MLFHCCSMSVLLWSPNNIKLVCIIRQQIITCHFHCLQINIYFSISYLSLCFQKKDFPLNTPLLPVPTVHSDKLGTSQTFCESPMFGYRLSLFASTCHHTDIMQVPCQAIPSWTMVVCTFPCVNLPSVDFTRVSEKDVDF